jgi:hypothetical protein
MNIPWELKQYINSQKSTMVTYSSVANRAEEISDGAGTRVWIDSENQRVIFETYDGDDVKAINLDLLNGWINPIDEIVFTDSSSIKGMSDEAGDEPSSDIALSQVFAASCITYDQGDARWYKKNTPMVNTIDNGVLFTLNLTQTLGNPLLILFQPNINCQIDVNNIAMIYQGIKSSTALCYVSGFYQSGDAASATVNNYWWCSLFGSGEALRIYYDHVDINKTFNVLQPSNFTGVATFNSNTFFTQQLNAYGAALFSQSATFNG